MRNSQPFNFHHNNILITEIIGVKPRGSKFPNKKRVSCSDLSLVDSCYMIFIPVNWLAEVSGTVSHECILTLEVRPTII